MSEYLIKSYQPDFIEEQVEVGKEIVKDWKYLLQTSVEQLKEFYSQPDFDPETRLYCFKGDSLVGFLTSKTMKEEEDEIGFLRFPFVLDEHSQVSDLLMERILEVFKAKGVSRIQAVAGELWGDSLEIAEKWDFKPLGDRASAYLLDVKSYEMTEEEVAVVQLDFDTDLDQVAEIYHQEYDRDLEKMKQNFENLRTNDSLLSIPVVKEEGKIVALGMMYKDETPELSVQVHSFVKDSKYYKSIQNEIVKRCQELDIETIQLFFRVETFHLTSEYEQVGFEYETKTILFEKEI